MAFIYPTPFGDPVYSICFLSSHEKYAVLLEVVKPLIVCIRTILNNNRPFREIERFEHLGFMGFSIGNGYECRQVS